VLFTHVCTACERTQLIFPSQAHGVTTTQHGTELTFTCWCGAEQSHVLSRTAVHAG